MDEGLDPAKKQYLIFAVIIAFVISVLLNFFFIQFLEGTFLYGFPLDLKDVSGFSGFITRGVNTLVMTLTLSVPTYLGIMWLINRPRY